jgi:hypothetical protein
MAAPVDLLGSDARLGQRLPGEPAHGHLEDLVAAVELVVIERVVPRLVAALAEIDLVELVLVDDDDAARLDVADIGLEAGRVHRHQGVDPVAGRVDVAGGEADLEPRHAIGRAAGGPDLRWKIGEGRDVVAEDGRGRRELAAGELHAVAGVAAEANDHGIQQPRLEVSLRAVRLGGHYPRTGKKVTVTKAIIDGRGAGAVARSARRHA